MGAEAAEASAEEQCQQEDASQARGRELQIAGRFSGDKAQRLSGGRSTSVSSETMAYLPRARNQWDQQEAEAGKQAAAAQEEDMQGRG